MLASLLFPYDNDAPALIDEWLAELERESCLVRYLVEGQSYMQICNWLNHQKIDKPSKSKIPAFDESSRILANPRECSSEDQGVDQGVDQGSRKEHSAQKAARFDFRSELLTLEVDPLVADDWLKLRSKKKAANTKTALDGFVAEVQKAGISVDAAVRECCARSWQGFKAEWIAKNARGSPAQSVHQERADTIAVLTGRGKNERAGTAERDITGECSRIS